MTFIDYLVYSVLILIVVRQVVESRFDEQAIILPLAIVAVLADSYLHAIPTGGNDLLLIAGLPGVGWVDGSRDQGAVGTTSSPRAPLPAAEHRSARERQLR